MENSRFVESTCIGCGCTDSRACIDPKTHQGCSWLLNDRKIRRGVCSTCVDAIPRWKSGNREINSDKTHR